MRTLSALFYLILRIMKFIKIIALDLHGKILFRLLKYSLGISKGK